MSSEEPLFESGDYIDPPESKEVIQKDLARSRSRSASASTRESSVHSFQSQQQNKGKRWRVEAVIGTGAFGELYNAFDVIGEKNYAVKFEKPRNDGTSKLIREAELSKRLCESLNAVGGKSLVPRFYEYQNTKKGPYMVLELMGRDLSRVRKLIRHHKLSLCSTGFLGKQLIATLEKVHDMGIVHRDIKPQNLVLGNSQATKLDVCLIDFGLAKDNFFPQKQCRYQPETGASFRGTAAYASLAALTSIEQGKRDDLEGAFWVFIDLLWGGLPWRRMSFAKSKERDETIRKGKRNIFDAHRDNKRKYGGIGLPPPHGNSSSNNNKFPRGMKSYIHHEGIFGGPLDEENGKLRTTTELNGYALLDALPPCMLRYLDLLRDLEFARRPDYKLFYDCFQELEELGDCPNFRRKFSVTGSGNSSSSTGSNEGLPATSRRDAIAREVYAKDSENDCWNKITKVTSQSGVNAAQQSGGTSSSSASHNTNHVVSKTNNRASENDHDINNKLANNKALDERHQHTIGWIDNNYNNWTKINNNQNTLDAGKLKMNAAVSGKKRGRDEEQQGQASGGDGNKKRKRPV